MSMVHLYGKELLDGKTVTVDHVVQEFTVVIRSCGGIGLQDLKDQLQKKWEVVRVGKEEETTYVV